MSILSALKETQHSNNNLDDLAKLPQALIMQMAQNGQIPKDMVMPILGKKAEMVETAAKMKAAQALAQQGGVQPTVMEKYMGEIAQAEHPVPPMPQQQMQQPMPQQMAQSPMPQGPEDVGIASQATAPMQMAGGGIIAFSPGGDVPEDDDTEDRYDVYRKKAQRNADFAGIDAMRQELAGMPVSENRGVGITAGHHGAERGMVSDADQARKHNVGNLRPSNFSYPGQVGTSKGGFAMFDSPEAGMSALQHDIGIKLNRGLDTPHKFISVYAPAGDKNDVGAYSKNVASMLGIKPNEKIPNTPEARQLLAQAIIRQEGAHKATASFAQGGIAHYAAGGYEDDQYSPEGVLISGGSTMVEPEKPAWEKEWEKKYLKKPKDEKGLEKIVGDNTKPVAVPNTNVVDPRFNNVTGVADESKKQDFNLIDYIREQQAERKEAAKMDKWQAGLAAGLGMLGGTSQYAWENIGKGGQMGVQQLAQSQKLRAAENKAAGELYGDAARMDLANKQRGDVLKEKAREHNEKQALAGSDKLNAAIAAVRKAPQNATNMLMLNALESQFANGKLDPSKVPELERLRKWNQSLENSVRQNFVGATGTTEGYSARRIGG